MLSNASRYDTVTADSACLHLTMHCEVRSWESGYATLSRSLPQPPRSNLVQHFPSGSSHSKEIRSYRPHHPLIDAAGISSSRYLLEVAVPVSAWRPVLLDTHDGHAADELDAIPNMHPELDTYVYQWACTDDGALLLAGVPR